MKIIIEEGWIEEALSDIDKNNGLVFTEHAIIDNNLDIRDVWRVEKTVARGKIDAKNEMQMQWRDKRINLPS